MKKVLFISNIPTHYKIALLNHVDLQLKKQDVSFKVLFVAPTRPGREGWSHSVNRATFNWEYLEKIRILSFDFIRHIRTIIDKRNGDVVIISGNSNFYAFQISTIARLKGIPQIFYTGIPGDTRGLIKDNFLLIYIRRIWRKYLFANADAIIGHGQTHIDYATGLIKGKTKPFFIAYNTTDITKFFRADQPCDRDIQATFDRANQNCNLLYCGNIVQGKGLDLLFQALHLIKKLDFALHIVGSGDQTENLKNLSKQLGIDHKIVFWDRVPPEQISSFYFCTDVLVFPTRGDIWGLVSTKPWPHPCRLFLRNTRLPPLRLLITASTDTLLIRKIFRAFQTRSRY
jgi:glycosyltransferase involved in cell wall biosynthesis